MSKAGSTEQTYRRALQLADLHLELAKHPLPKTGTAHIGSARVLYERNKLGKAT
ncbi:hypothetical protein KFU94_48255 [Chloroflexi bacterium TSY]|nr:hypothetical protein [Chloroflexi bacterium TSY]